MMEPTRNKTTSIRFYTDKKPKIEFSNFDRDLLLDPLKLTEENEVLTLFTKVQRKLKRLGENINESEIFDEEAEKIFYAAKARLNELDSDEIFNSFSVDLEPDGGAIVNVMHYETCLTVHNHIGNLYALRNIIKNELKDNKLFNTSNLKSNQTKPLYKSKKPAKANETFDLIRKHLCLIEFCFLALKKTVDFSIYRDNEFFEIYEVYPIRIRFRNSTGIYTVSSILSLYFDMISKCVCKQIYKKNARIENIIVAFPQNYDLMQQIEIKRAIQGVGLAIREMITQDELDNLFFQVQFELDKLKESDTEEAALNVNSFNDKEVKELSYEKHYIEIDIKENGYCSVKLLRDYDSKLIQNHIGDLDTLKTLLNTINNTKYEKLINLVQNYMGLVESSFEYLLKNETETLKSVDFGLFESLAEGETKYSFRVKKTSEIFSVGDLLVKYFEVIVKAAWQASEHKTQEIYLRTDPCFKINHQYELKKYIEKATNNYVRICSNKMHELFFKVQENLEQKPFKPEKIKTSTLDIPIVKIMLEKNEIESDYLIVTLQDNYSVIVEKIENQELSVIRGHIGDFDAFGVNLKPNRQSKAITQNLKEVNNRAKQPDENTQQTKFIYDFLYFMRFCFQAFYDKGVSEAKSEIFEVIPGDPLKIRMKNSMEEYKINEIIIKFFQFILSQARKSVKICKVKKLVLITPSFYGIPKQFKLKDVLEKTRLEVTEVFSDNQLYNLYMKLHNKICSISKTQENRLIEYEGTITEDDLEKNHTFGVDFSEKGKIHVIVLKDEKCYEIFSHIANIHVSHFSEVDRLGIDDFAKLLEITIDSFNSENTTPMNTQIFSSSGKYPTKVRLGHSAKEFSTEDILKSYFECIARSVWEATGVVARNVILAVPPEYSIETILIIDSCIKRSNLKCRKLISNNDLHNIFFQINCLFYDSQIEYPLDGLVISPKVTSARSYEEIYKTIFNISYEGNVQVQVSEKGKMKNLNNHFGDFDAITREFLKNTRLLARFKLGPENNIISKIHSENVEIAESFQKLISYCFDAFNKETEKLQNRKFKLFQLSNSSPVKIKLKNSTSEYKPIEILTCYFKCIISAIYRQTGIKPKYVTCSIARMMPIEDEVKLKECLEKSDVKLIKMVSNNELNDVFFNLNCQFEIFIKTYQGEPVNDEVEEEKQVSVEEILSKIEQSNAYKRIKQQVLSENNKNENQTKLPKLDRLTSTPVPLDAKINENKLGTVSHIADLASKQNTNSLTNSTDSKINSTADTKTTKLPIIITTERADVTKSQNIATSTPKIDENIKLNDKPDIPPTAKAGKKDMPKPIKTNMITQSNRIRDDIINISFQETGDTVIKSTKQDRIIEDHIGNFNVLSLLSSYKEFDANLFELPKMQNAKIRNESIKDLKALIKFCFISLKGIQPENCPKDNSIFKASVSDQKITFKKSYEASVNEVLIIYLQCLMKSLSPIVIVESCNFEFEINYEFSLFEQFELKKCAERANIQLYNIKTNNPLNDLFFQLNFKLETLEQNEESYNRVEINRFEIYLKKILIDNIKSFGLFLYDDLKVLTSKRSKLVSVVNHIGNFQKLNIISKLIDEKSKNMTNFATSFKRLLIASLESFESNGEKIEFKIENELFKTSDDGCIQLTYDNFTKKYSFVHVFYNYIECISRTVSDYIGDNAYQVVFATPFKPNITSEFKLKELMSRTRFHLIDIISENNLINLFCQVSNLMQAFAEFENKRGKKTTLPTKIKNSTLKKLMNNTIDSSNTTLMPLSNLEHLNKDLLTFHLKSNGETCVNLLSDKTVMTVTNHIGDFNSILAYVGLKEQFIAEKRKNLTADSEYPDTNPESFEKLYSEVRLIKHYRKLIDVCFQFVRGLSIEYNNEVDDIYDVLIKKSKLFIRFKFSNVEYEAADVLGLYFESISNFVNKKLGVELINIRCVVSSEFDIYAQYELRRCMERANLKLIQISTPDELQNLFLDVESVLFQFIDEMKHKKNIEKSETVTISTETTNSLKYNESFCIQLNVDGAAKISAINYKHEPCILDYHVGDFSALSGYNKSDVKTHEFIENYRNLIKFCINSLGKPPSNCFTQRINLFKVIKGEKIKFVSKTTLAEYSIEDVLMTYFKFMMTSVWRITKEKTRQILLSVPLDYEEKITLKLCIEKANIKVMKIITKPIARCFDIYLTDLAAKRFGTYIFVDEDAVVLYKVEDSTPLKIMSSLMDSKESYKLFIKSFNLHLKKQIPKFVSKLVSAQEFSRDVLFKCYDQFNDGQEEAVLKFDEDEIFKIKKTELYEMAEKYIIDTCQLIDDILEQHGETDSNLACVYYVFANFMAEDLKKVILNSPVLRYVDSNTALLNIAIMNQKLLTTDSHIGIIKTLNFNIGFCNHLGIFELLLKQGLTLPCEISKVFTTVVNYQTAIELELYRGFRPLERYCEFLGIVSVKDISVAKANKVKIDVKFIINENEELIVEAYERPSNKKLTLETENFKMKSKYEHNFHDSVVNKENDEKLVEKLKLTSSLINRIRARYDGNADYDELVSKKMDEFTNKIIQSNKIIDIAGCEKVVEEIQEWLKENNLSME